MSPSRAAAIIGCLLFGAALPSPAVAAQGCGVVSRPFTDGGAQVTVRKGALKCSTARGLMRRYWNTSVDAFKRRVQLRYAGIRWTYRPTVNDFPYRWSCTGGGRNRDRFQVTARE